MFCGFSWSDGDFKNSSLKIYSVDDDGQFCAYADVPFGFASFEGDALCRMMLTNEEEFLILQAYLQIVLARCIPLLELDEKSKIGSDDLIYQTVAYISGHFRENVTLDKMAQEIGVSKYAVSRVFSGTFHSNFNQYLNDTRLRYACAKLENTTDSIIEICLDSGFESQRTFNRVFKERYRMSPSVYRKMIKEQSTQILH